MAKPHGKVVFEFDLRVNGNKIKLPTYEVIAEYRENEPWFGPAIVLSYPADPTMPPAKNGRLAITQRVDYDEENREAERAVVRAAQDAAFAIAAAVGRVEPGIGWVRDNTDGGDEAMIALLNVVYALGADGDPEAEGS